VKRDATAPDQFRGIELTDVGPDDERLAVECNCGRRKLATVPDGTTDEDRRYVLLAYCEIESRVNDCCSGQFHIVDESEADHAQA